MLLHRNKGLISETRTYEKELAKINVDGRAQNASSVHLKQKLTVITITSNQGADASDTLRTRVVVKTLKMRK